MIFTDFKKSIQPIIEGTSYRSIYKLLYFISLFKYSKRNNLQKAFSSANKVATKDKLRFLSNLGYFDIHKDVIIANKTTNIIVESFDTKDLGLKYKPILPELPQGLGGINELNNTKVFTKAVNLIDYYALLFPNFGYLRPDALLVRKREDKYKLEFLEIEAEKPNWKEYLEDKKSKYLKLSRDKNVFDYWNSVSFNLKLPTDISSFKFTVKFITDINYDFGYGFHFLKELSDE